jgi:hypothetical protein
MTIATFSTEHGEDITSIQELLDELEITGEYTNKVKTDNESPSGKLYITTFDVPKHTTVSSIKERMEHLITTNSEYMDLHCCYQTLQEGSEPRDRRYRPRPLPDRIHQTCLFAPPATDNINQLRMEMMFSKIGESDSRKLPVIKLPLEVDSSLPIMGKLKMIYSNGYLGKYNNHYISEGTYNYFTTREGIYAHSLNNEGMYIYGLLSWDGVFYNYVTPDSIRYTDRGKVGEIESVTTDISWADRIINDNDYYPSDTRDIFLHEVMSYQLSATLLQEMDVGLFTFEDNGKFINVYVEFCDIKWLYTTTDVKDMIISNYFPKFFSWAGNTAKLFYHDELVKLLERAKTRVTLTHKHR